MHNDLQQRRDVLTRELTVVLHGVLGDVTIDPDDDFYSVGGDSLLALRVVTEARAKGIALDLKDILYFPVISDLAGELAARLATEVHESIDLEGAGLHQDDANNLPEGVIDAWPASALQVGLIFSAELAEDSMLYHDLVGFSLPGEFDEHAFLAAIGSLYRRHAALRSSFDLDSFTEPLQLVWRDVEPAVEVTYGATSDDADSWRKDEMTRIFDWSRPSLFRCHVAVTPDRWVVTLSFHHAILDGWSCARLVVDLVRLYRAGGTSEAAGMQAVPAEASRAYVALERTAARGDERDESSAAAYWRAQAEPLPLFPEAERVGGVADPRERLFVPVGASAVDRLRALAAQVAVPLKSVVLASYARTLAAWTERREDLVTGLVVGARPELPGVDRAVGLFLNIVPIRFPTVHDDLATLSLLAYRLERDGFPFRRYPFSRVESALGRPAADVSFNFTDFHVYEEIDGIETGDWWSFDKASMPLVVDFMIAARGYGTGIEIAWDPELLAGRSVTSFAEQFATTLRQGS
jgi:aryl carrier-like protein